VQVVQVHASPEIESTRRPRLLIIHPSRNGRSPGCVIVRIAENV
jgi:hypothetical protein